MSLTPLTHHGIEPSYTSVDLNSDSLTTELRPPCLYLIPQYLIRPDQQRVVPPFFLAVAWNKGGPLHQPSRDTVEPGELITVFQWGVSSVVARASLSKRTC